MSVKPAVDRLTLYPITAKVNKKGHLEIGGCDTVVLAEEFGTPLYVFDESSIRNRCAEFKTEFIDRYPDTTALYSMKAFTNKAILRIIEEEGLGLDVVSGGELAIAESTGFPMDRVYFPGNNKSADELDLALSLNVNRIVVDNLYELNLLRKIAKDRRVDILLRLTPGVDPHTHRYNTTGTVDSKFGLPRSTWDEAMAIAMKAPEINAVGLHFHLGSGIFEVEPYQRSIEIILEFAADMKQKYSFELLELDVGGGYGIQYITGEEPPSIATWSELLTQHITGTCEKFSIPLPRLIIEPGRSIIGRAGVALYRAGAVKDIPGVRRYVSVDGGMGDNIRHALYGARHEAVIANKAGEKNSQTVTISGKFCETGDILIKDIELPPVSAGDVIAVASCGAYCLPTASNYNSSLRPAVVMVRDGSARLIRRRETLEDLTRNDVL
jgi:diaminopimelate decarboxylase